MHCVGEGPGGKDVRGRRMSIRVSEVEQALIEQAARSDRMSAGEFMLRASLRSAEEALAEQQHFALTRQQWAEFVAALDRPPAAVAALARAARLASPELTWTRRSASSSSSGITKSPTSTAASRSSTPT